MRRRRRRRRREQKNANVRRHRKPSRRPNRKGSVFVAECRRRDEEHEI